MADGRRRIEKDRDLDALISHKIIKCICRRKDGSILYDEIPDYSTNIAHAWRVVEKMRSLGFHFCLHQYEGNNHWNAQFDKDDLDVVGSHGGQGETPALAICLAALKTMPTDLKILNLGDLER